ncbi:MAG TPA: HlyD family type I secretion periplasmic adaptor subunit [Arenibaculum sp.]|nr:HlyD family type I secretion periplasmic adaptor subunit [Arenibaculum sp.]
MSVTDDTPHSAGTAVRGLRHLGWATIAVFFVGFGGWAYTAPLTAAAIADGIVIPDGKRRTVQHLEGGIVSEILVRDGTHVEAGQPVLALSDIRARSAHDRLAEQRDILATVEARLIAEQRQWPTPAFPTEIAGSADPELRDMIALQLELFATRKASRDARKLVLRQRIRGLEEEIAGLEARIRSQETQLALIAEEVEAVRILLEKGLERKPRLLALERARAEIEGARADYRTRIAGAHQRIEEIRAEILAQTEQWRDEVAAALADTRTRLTTLDNEMDATHDALERTVVRAPLTGTVMDLRVTTVGGVISPGEPLLDIVPKGGELRIDARVSPLDIDSVHAGLVARVVLPAYAQRNLPRLMGRVRDVSADRLTDQETGLPYFLARVVVAEAELAQLGQGIEMVPGMPAEVLIETGERTMYDYLAGPFLDAVRRSFREK